MIEKVNWQYIILDGDPTLRVKRKKAPLPVINFGADFPKADSWNSAPPPKKIPFQGRDFIFAFWSLMGQDAISGQSTAQIQSPPPPYIANDAHKGGIWTISAKAYYVWDFGVGPGDNAVLIDAFDSDAGDFLADDFVDVKPDQNGILAADANNGYINTTKQIAKGSSITITARDVIPGQGMVPAKKFAYWLPIASLLFSNDAKVPATVGAPDPHDIVAHYHDVVVAFAFYNEFTPARIDIVPPGAIFNPWWWIETLGGLVPPKPRGPWLEDFMAALTLAATAGRVSPKLRAGVLELALKQLSITSAAIKKEIKALRRK